MNKYEREAFEEWFASEYPDVDVRKIGGIQKRNTAWKAWQARSTIDAELVETLEQLTEVLEDYCAAGNIHPTSVLGANAIRGRQALAKHKGKD